MKTLLICLCGIIFEINGQQCRLAYENMCINSEIKEGCVVHILSLTEPQPSLVINGKLIAPNGNSRLFRFSKNSTITASCFGKNNLLYHPNAINQQSSANLICRNDYYTSPKWLGLSMVKLPEVKCVKHSPWIEELDEVCGNGNGFSIAVGVSALSPKQINLYKSCFDDENASVLYVEYSQTPESILSPKAARTDFIQGNWYPNLSVNTLYKTQKSNVASVIGKEMTELYYSITYLARGHLAAKTDFVLSTEQRATFSYINCVPKWQTFNNGNWYKLENNLRSRISNGNFNTTIYTGSWGILQLRDSNNNFHDIYLSPRTKLIPVPLWVFKVVHDQQAGKATAFLGLNNPFVTLEEAKSLTFCKDMCFNNTNFNWLEWNAHNITAGYSICCDVDDNFRKAVKYLPNFQVHGRFY